MQTPIKWNDDMPGMRGSAILRRKELPKNSNGLSLSGVCSNIQEKSQAQGEEGIHFCA